MLVGVGCVIIGSIGYGLLKNFVHYILALAIMSIIIVAIYLFFAFYGKFFTAREKKYFLLGSKLSSGKSR